MAYDYVVPSMSDAEVRRHAAINLSNFGVTLEHSVDIVEILHRGEIQSLFGKRRLTLETLIDHEMGDNDAQTCFAKQTASIQVRFIVLSDAKRGIGRARMTLAHELGHAVLHNGPVMGRRHIEKAIPKHIAAHQSAEHQAKIFAAATLMPQELIGNCKSVDEIAQLAKVSYDAARIQWEFINAAERRKLIARKFRDLAAEIKLCSTSRKKNYLNDTCPVCKKQELIPSGSRKFCEYCRNNSNNYQDGDSQD